MVFLSDFQIFREEVMNSILNKDNNKYILYTMYYIIYIFAFHS